MRMDSIGSKAVCGAESGLRTVVTALIRL